MGEFDEYITGVMELEVGGRTLKLNATIEDKRKIKHLFARNSANQSKEVTEEYLKELDDAFIALLVKSYPNENVEGIKGFYDKFDEDFLKEFLKKVGWIPEDKFETILKEAGLEETQKQS